MIKKNDEKLRSIFTRMFSLKEDTAAPEEIRARRPAGV